MVCHAVAAVFSLDDSQCLGCADILRATACSNDLNLLLLTTLPLLQLQPQQA
jgi:hypothetical protein